MKGPGAIVLSRQAERDHEVIVGADSEGVIVIIGITVYADLVIEQLLRQNPRLWRLGKEKPAHLQDGLKSRDQPSITQRDHAIVMWYATITVGEVHGDRPDPGYAEHVTDRLTDAGRIRIQAEGYGSR